MTDEIYVHRASKSHFVVGYCLRFYVETRFEAYFLITFEAVFSKREILQARYKLGDNSLALYKFQTANLNSLIALKNSSLFFSSFDKLNDATEMMFGFSSSIDEKDSKWFPDIEDLRSNAVLCMGIDVGKDDLSTDLLMWTHYGAALSGICLVFDEQMLMKSFEEQSCEFHDRVNYGFPKLLTREQLINENSGLEQVPGVSFTDHNRRRMINSFIFQKPKCFSYESEYRFIFQKSGLIPYNPLSLKRIVIGSKIGSSEIEKNFIEVSK
jgi:hypothetical protein